MEGDKKDNSVQELPQNTQEQKKLIPVSTGFSVQPQNLGELMTFARMLADSDLVPKDYKGKAGNIMVAMQMGSEIGILPMQAIQNIAVINGKPAVYGDLGKALLRSRGCDIEESDIEAVKKEGRSWCRITRQGQKPVERTFSIDDARTAKLWGKEGPWTTYPFRQMAWRAFWFAARDAAPDILKGLMGREEVEDYDHVEGESKHSVAIEDMMPKRISVVKSYDKDFPAVESSLQDYVTKPESKSESQNFGVSPELATAIKSNEEAVKAIQPEKENISTIDPPITAAERGQIDRLMKESHIENGEFVSFVNGLGVKDCQILKSQFQEVLKWLKVMKPAS